MDVFHPVVVAGSFFSDFWIILLKPFGFFSTPLADTGFVNARTSPVRESTIPTVIEVKGKSRLKKLIIEKAVLPLVNTLP